MDKLQFVIKSFIKSSFKKETLLFHLVGVKIGASACAIAPIKIVFEVCLQFGRRC